MSLEGSSTIIGGEEAGLEQIWMLNKTVPASIDDCVHTIISRRAAEHPDKTAVSAWDGELTYSELDELSTHLSLHLMGLGVTTDSIVPICFEKSMWTPVAVLSVLKAGSAFSLLDISQPEARLYAMVQQCRATLICSSYSNQELSARLATKVVVVGPEKEQIDFLAAGASFLPKPDPARPMYVCYTSGSTGVPKGIIITHANMCTALEYQIRLLGFDAESRTFDFASYSFDVAVHNIFATLVAGGCLCTPSDMDRKYRLTESIRAMKATIVDLTASVSRLVDTDMVPDLQTLLFLGEAVNVSDIERWWGKVKVINTYGPAECTPISTINLAATSVVEAPGIGKGVGVVTWIVDPKDHNSLVPYGDVGELVLEGPVLARGYLFNPESTTAAFIEDPPWLLRGYAGFPGRHGRVYKTGDLVRYNENGELGFVGRKDTQVKIRGQRVELGEVEYHVQKSMTGVNQVVAEVIETEANMGKAVLVAFLEMIEDLKHSDEAHSTSHSDSSSSRSGRHESTPTNASLDASLMVGPDRRKSSINTSNTTNDSLSSSESWSIYEDIRTTKVNDSEEVEISNRLPTYMVPTVYFKISRIPLSPTGKANRKLLREAGSSILAHLSTIPLEPDEQPRTVKEQYLCNLWATLLDRPVESISIKSNFFKLGGDSISVIKLVGAARKDGFALSVGDIFERPTLATQSEVLAVAEGQGAEPVAPFSLLVDTRFENKVERLRREISVLCSSNESSIEDAYPCTALQEGLLALTSKRAGDYVLQSVLELSEDIDLDRLRKVWGETVRAAPILRTRIVQHHQLDLIQVVCNESTELYETEVDRLDNYLQKDKLISIGLGERLSRSALIRDSSTARPRWLVWTAHHALVDGWSIPLVLESFNNSFGRRKAEHFPRPGFNSFVKYLAEARRNDVDYYWRSYLGDGVVESFPALPSSTEVVLADTTMEFEQPLPQKSVKIDEDKEATISTIIRAALAILIWSQTGQTDVVFGTTLSGRNLPLPSIETIMGPLIATVPLRVEIHPRQTILDFLNCLQRQAIEMIPFEQTGLREIAKIDSHCQTACNFQTLVVVQPLDAELAIESECGIWRPSSVQQSLTTYALTLECLLQRQGIKIRARFDSSVVPKWRMEMMLQQFGMLLKKVSTAHVGQMVGEIDSLTTQDKNLIWKWNKLLPAAVDRSIHDLIGDWTQSQPEATALSGDDQKTYNELNTLSTRLAYLLVKLGVGSDVIVPLIFEKSIWTVVAMLAVLKSGGAFTALDPAQACERRQFILDKVKARLVLTSPTYTGISLRPDCSSLEVSANSILDISEPPQDTCLPYVPPTSAAYVIFTSGTTGEPKGVVIEHRAIATSSHSYGPIMGLNRSSRFLQFASYTFDASILEIITTLVLGGCVCVPSETERTTNIPGAINAMHVNIAILTPTVARMIQPKDVPSLRTLVLGGEAVAKTDYEQWQDSANLLNAYGPTECAVCSVLTHFKRGITEFNNIGKAVGCVSWVVNPNDHSKLAPVGAIGELLLEGPILARGYLEDSEKTTKAFLDSPPWLLSERCSRLYKTGDLVRYNQDGTLTFIRRKDNQVKIHGQRVELGEIEHHLRYCIPTAAQIVAEVIKPSGTESGLLAAFIEMNECIESEISSPSVPRQVSPELDIMQMQAGVYDELSQRLPGYMIPTVYFKLSRIPQMPSGKTDRRKLRELCTVLSVQQLANSQSAELNKKRKPVTGLEQRLGALWAEVLGIQVDTIGLDDSFFRLGGDSVMAMKLVAAVRRTGMSITVAEIFLQPSLSGQVGVIRVDGLEEPKNIPPFHLLTDSSLDEVDEIRNELSELCHIDPLLIEDAYPCTPLQEGLISLTIKNSGDYVLQMVLDLSNEVEIDTLRTAWERLSRLMGILRTRIVQHNRLGLVQVVCQENIVWTELMEHDLEGFLEKDKMMPMGLNSVLSRFSLIKDTLGQPRWLVWTVHHALYDGWSLPLILNLVDDIYQGKVIGEQPGFNAFIGYLAEMDINDHESYWNSYLVDTQPTPVAFINTSTNGITADTTLEYVQPLPQTWTKRQAEATTSTLIRTALAIIINSYTGSEDVVFGATVSGRHAPVPRIDEMAGPTIATVPIRVKVRKDDRVQDHIREVQNEVMQMIPHEQMGLHRIARMSESAKEACDFQILLVIQPTENKDLHHTMGQWRLVSGRQEFTTYPLTLECILDDTSVKFKGIFDSGVTDDWKVDAMLSRLGSTLWQLANAEPSQTLEMIDVVAHDKTLFSEWNQLIPDVVNKCIHELIEERAQLQLIATAVCSWDGKLSYSELSQLSTNLAAHLTNFIAPQTFVPLCFEKSMWTVVAMLAVLKAGGAFILLDPGLPQARLELMCTKVQAVVCLTSVACRTRFENLVPRVIEVGPNIRELSSSKSQLPKTDPKDAAYIIFTSGSTGTPKGCIIEHRSYCTATLSHGSDLGFSTSTRALQIGSYLFAGSLMEILMTLINGGCVCVLSDEERVGSRLAQAICKLNANWAFLTSSILSFLKPEAVPSLRTICVGGESIRSSQIKQWAPHLKLCQTYGSAETSTVVSLAQLSISSAHNEVGQAITGRYWIVDPNDANRLMPIGAIGELLIEGPVIGRCYLEEPEKTAAAFISPPTWTSQFDLHGVQGLSQFYRTGDLAAYKADGSIELLGRKDMQVKLQGQRIEPGEIEYQIMMSTADIAAAAVEIALPNQREGRNKAMLIGFIVWKTPQCDEMEPPIASNNERYCKSATLKEVRSSLEKSLPYFMVPSLFMSMPELPYTVSKKLDRKVLREIGYNITAEQMSEMQRDLAGEKRTPHTPNEKRLQSLWAQVLDADESSIGLDDSFFQLGGDSILAVKLVGAARKAGISMTVADLFRQPVLVAQAQTLTIIETKPATDEVPPFSLLVRPGVQTQIRRELSVLCSVDAKLIEDAYPCTPLQEGLLSLTAKRAGDYTMQNVLDISNSVNIDSFKSAWQAVVSHTPILRTRIVQTSLGMLQVVCKERIEWMVAEQLDCYLFEDKAAPMMLGKCLCRFALVTGLDGVPKKFIWTVHHALYDGWSLPRIFDLVNQAYRGLKLPDTTGFNSFMKQIIMTKGSEAFWKSYLGNGNFQTFPPLPPCVREPSVDSVLSHKEALPISGESIISIKSEATMSTLIHAALGIVIGRHTGLKDVVFGTISSGRSFAVPGIEDMIGPTIATVPMRVQTPDGHTIITDYLQLLQTQATEMIVHEQTGLQKIAQINKHTKRACAFQTLLVIQSESLTSQSEDTILGKRWSVTNHQDFATYALNLECVVDKNGDFHTRASFDSRVLDPWITSCILKQLGTVLHRLIAAQPGDIFDELESPLPTEILTISEWNREAPETVGVFVTDFIQSQVKCHPTAPAVLSWDGELTYQELDFFALRLAQYLVLLGVGPEDIVPLCFEKSQWAIVAMLAVLKAGGVFVCFDPGDAVNHPRSQLMKDSSTQVVLTSTEFSSIEVPDNCISIAITRDFISSLETPRQEDIVSPCTLKTSAAYVVYTSGTTGDPKGVTVEHSALATGCYNYGQTLGINTTSRVLQFSPYTFHVSIQEILATLSYGGCVCVPRQDQIICDLTTTITAMNVNTATLTPTVARTILPDKVPTLATLILTGETPLQNDYDRWGGLHSLINMYGLTECTTPIMIEKVEPSMKVGIMQRTVGCTSWVIDPTDDSRLSPLGALGELVLEGPTLARGYLYDPERTMSAFSELPPWLVQNEACSNTTGLSKTLFRTGDLVRYTKDGRLKLIGRKEMMPRLHGQQVDLAEIECYVQGCVKSVTQVVAEVIVPAGDETRKVLGVFMEMKPEVILAPDEMPLLGTRFKTLPQWLEIVMISADEEDELLRRLPAYMVPELYLQVAHMPLLASGKVDRKKLRLAISNLSTQQLKELTMKPKTAKLKRPPVTDTERRICALWAEVLSIEKDNIGLDDTFLGLGGDSIGAMKLTGAARQARVNLTVANVFKYSSLGDLATHVDRQGPKSQKIPAPKPFSLLDASAKDGIVQSMAFQAPRIHPDDIADILPLTAYQEDNLQQSLKWPRQSFNYFFLDFSHDLNVKHLEQSCQALLRQYPILRSVFIGSQGRHWQVVLKKLLLPLRVIDVQDPVASAAHSICIQETENSFFQPGEPTVSTTLVRSVGMGCRMILRLSHATYDGVSLPIIIKTLLDFLQSKPLPPPMDFSLFLSYSRQQEPSSIEYWRRILEGSRITQVAHLLTNGLQETGSKLHQPRKILVEDVAGIVRLPDRITLSTLVNAACAIVLSAITGELDIVYGGLMIGRNSNIPTIQNVVGPCMNVVPIRAQLSRYQTPYELMQSMQEQFHLIGEADSLGLDKIIEHGTTWGPGSNFDFFLQHQNIDEDPEFELNGTCIQARAFYNPSFVPTTMGVLSFPNEDGVKIQLLANTHIMTHTTADALHDAICKTVAMITAYSDSPLLSCRPDVLRIRAKVSS